MENACDIIGSKLQQCVWSSGGVITGQAWVEWDARLSSAVKTIIELSHDK